MNEYGKQWYHIQDTLNHKIKLQELFIQYINNCIDSEMNINENSLIYMIMNKDDCFTKSRDSIVRTLIINSFIKYENTLSYKDMDMNTIKITSIIYELSKRMINHDNSKIEYLPEFNLYKDVVYKLNGLEHGTKEHTEAKKQLDQGFEIHCINNRHHPEHFNSEGICGMNIYDIIEMILDWCSAAVCRGFKFKLSSIYRRIESHSFSKELCDILSKNIYLILDKDQIINDLEK